MKLLSRYTGDMGGHFYVPGFKFHWNKMSDDWSMTRVWRLAGLLTVIHTEPGLKSTRRWGWSFAFPSIRIERQHHGFAICFRSSDMGY